MFIKKNKSIDSSWIKKINFGKNPNSQDLLDPKSFMRGGGSRN